MDISKNMRFAHICVMFERVKKAKNQASKEKIIRAYYYSFQEFRKSLRDTAGLTAADPEVST